MTEQQACTLCGAGGHTAAQCKWGESLKLLRDLRQPLLDASMEYDEALSPLVGRIDSLLGRLLSSRDQECSQCGGSGYDCPNCIADFEREQAEGAQGERFCEYAGCCAKAHPNTSLCLEHHTPKNRATLAQPSPAPELERPVAVAYRSSESGSIYEQDYGLKNPEPLMEVAQHDRIVGALRAENSILRSGMRGDFDLDAWLQWAAERQSAPVAQAGQVPQAWLDVQAERRRQVEAEGWTPDHDDEHGGGQMARAAACYALAGSCAPNDETAAILVDLAWPWAPEWWKPTASRRDLVKSAALILAELERLDRAAAPAQGE